MRIPKCFNLSGCTWQNCSERRQPRVSTRRKASGSRSRIACVTGRRTRSIAMAVKARTSGYADARPRGMPGRARTFVRDSDSQTPVCTARRRRDNRNISQCPEVVLALVTVCTHRPFQCSRALDLRGCKDTTAGCFFGRSRVRIRVAPWPQTLTQTLARPIRVWVKHMPCAVYNGM